MTFIPDKEISYFEAITAKDAKVMYYSTLAFMAFVAGLLTVI